MMSRFSLIAGALPILALAACRWSDRASAVATAPTQEEIGGQWLRGQNLARDVCTSCHGLNLKGGLVGGVQCPALIEVRGLTAGQFRLALREGKDPTGANLHSLMSATQQLSPEDVEAIRVYLSWWIVACGDEMDCTFGLRSP